MGSTLAALVALAACFWLWGDARRHHEQAIRTVRRVAQASGVQLLDDTVALKRVRLARGASGWLALTRTYAFEVSQDGFTRIGGTVTLRQGSLQVIELPPLADPRDS